MSEQKAKAPMPGTPAAVQAARSQLKWQADDEDTQSSAAQVLASLTKDKQQQKGTTKEKEKEKSPKESPKATAATPKAPGASQAATQTEEKKDEKPKTEDQDVDDGNDGNGDNYQEDLGEGENYTAPPQPVQKFVYLLFPNNPKMTEKTVSDELTKFSVVAHRIHEWRNLSSPAFCIILSQKESQKLWDNRKDKSLREGEATQWILTNDMNVSPFQLREKNTLYAQRLRQRQPLSARALKITIPTVWLIDRNTKIDNKDKPVIKQNAAPFFAALNSQEAVEKMIADLLKPYKYDLINSQAEVKVQQATFNSATVYGQVYINFPPCTGHTQSPDEAEHPHVKTYCPNSMFAISLLQRILREVKWPIPECASLPRTMQNVIVTRPLIHSLRGRF